MKRYSTEEIYPRSHLGKCMVYFNMSHHYRRIYSAKPRVDTNLSKKSQPQYCCSSPDVFNFVKRNFVKQPIMNTPRYRVCAKDEEQTQQELFKPKILDYKAESKLRSLPVYQPPQKIIKTKSNQTDNKLENINNENIEPQMEDKENVDTEKNVSVDTKEEPIKESINKEKFVLPEVTNEQNWNEDTAKFRPLNKSTVMFLKDITDDILRKGIYTNKSLEKLFFHHMQKNKYNLPKELMEKEVARLKKELEMPLEDEKSLSETTVEDEEVLTALDSLLLPADIRDQVADSLGLKRKPPPLPSPKDSFTGSLVLTSMSEGQGLIGKQEVTYTVKTDEFKDAAKEIKSNEDAAGSNTSDIPRHSEDSKTAVSDYDDTIADEDYPEEVDSEHTSNAPEAASEQISNNPEIKSEEKSVGTDVSEEKSNSTEIKSEEEVDSSEDKEATDDPSEIKSEVRNDDKESPEGNESKNNSDGITSEEESIHTETE